MYEETIKKYSLENIGKIDFDEETEIDMQEFKVLYPSILTDEEYSELNLPPKQYYLNNLIATEGTHYLTGKVKDGKSILTMGITEALTKQRIYVYYYAAEDDDARIKERLQKIKNETDGRLLIQTKYGKEVPPPSDFLDYVRDMVNRFPMIKVFIFDTARFAVAHSKITQNDPYEGNYNEITPWNNLAHELGVCFIMIGHNNQSKDADGFDAMYGNTGLTASYENLLMMKRSSEGKMLLKCAGKDLPHQTFELEEVKDQNGVFVRYNIGKLFDESLQGDMKKLLVQIVKDNGSPMTRTMIIEKLKEMEKPSGNVYRDVAILVKNRKLENTNGWYTVVPDIPD